MMLRVIFFLLISFPLVTSGQDSYSMPGIKLGTVWFKDKSVKLTKDAKATLDTLIRQIQQNPKMYVQAVTFNKDLCDKCGVRSWKRASAVLAYISKHGVTYSRLTSTNRLDGDLNKVDLFLTSTVGLAEGTIKPPL